MGFYVGSATTGHRIPGTGAERKSVRQGIGECPGVTRRHPPTGSLGRRNIGRSQHRFRHRSEIGYDDRCAQGLGLYGGSAEGLWLDGWYRHDGGRSERCRHIGAVPDPMHDRLEAARRDQGVEFALISDAPLRITREHDGDVGNSSIAH